MYETNMWLAIAYSEYFIAATGLYNVSDGVTAAIYVVIVRMNSQMWADCGSLLAHSAVFWHQKTNYEPQNTKSSHINLAKWIKGAIWSFWPPVVLWNNVFTPVGPCLFVDFAQFHWSTVGDQEKRVKKKEALR